MSTHPLNDRVKVKLDTDAFNLGDEKGLAETGVVVEVPGDLLYLSFHSFAFEKSIADEQTLERVFEHYNMLLGKRIYWEKLQDAGRHLKEEDGTEYVYLQMTDILAYSDDVNDKSSMIGGTGASQSFNLE